METGIQRQVAPSVVSVAATASPARLFIHGYYSARDAATLGRGRDDPARLVYGNGASQFV